MSKSNHSKVQLYPVQLFLLSLFLLFSLSGYSQLSLKCQMLYDVEEGWSEVAKVRVLQDNKEYETLETNKKGKFKLFLPLGHDYLIEVSKEYHFTTRFAISTKLPPAKMEAKPFLTQNIDGDLIRNFEGLDGSIMDKPILIFRYVPETDAFQIDDDHLNAVRDEVEKLMSASIKLKTKGATPVAKPLPPKIKKVEEKKPEIKEAPVIEKKEMISSKTHQDEVIEEKIKTPPPPPVTKTKTEPKSSKPEPIAEEPNKERNEDPNETYEMQLRRERLEKEKKRKENLALKRGYESSLIRQVAEENRRMSQAEIQKRTVEKEDSSLVEKARKEAEIKAARNQHRQQAEAKSIEANQNKQTKSQMESGMIREVAASARVIQAREMSEKPKGEETLQGMKYVLDAKVSETTSKDDFKRIENLFVEYPSYSKVYSKETYNFGMVNYYIDGSAVEKTEFCQGLDELKSYKFKLKCE